MMANVMTGLRILVSAVLLLCPAFSQGFYALYLIAGLSDVANVYFGKVIEAGHIYELGYEKCTCPKVQSGQATGKITSVRRMWLIRCIYRRSFFRGDSL